MSRGRAGDRVESTLRAFMRRLDPSDAEVFVVAYSGGPDSTALLGAAAALGSNRLLAVHVDHGLRPETERLAERELVRKSCADLGVRLTIARVRPGAIAAYALAAGCGTEAAARAFRYGALRKIMEREASSHALLAHTADDQVETVLMRLVGGSGALQGIDAVNPPWYRPFLGLSKKELLDYLQTRGLSWSTDSTNASTAFLRNRVRLRLIPLLDRDFPGWRRGLGLTVERAAMDAEAIREGAAAIGFAPEGEGRMAAEAASFFAAPEAYRVAALLAAGGKLMRGSRLSLRMARSALGALGSRDDGRYYGGGLRLEKREGKVLVGRGLDFPRHGGYFVVIDRPCRVRAGSLVVEASWTTDGVRGIRVRAFRFPLVVRSRRPGDSIAVPGGRKRLDDLFSEWGVPAELRGIVPVVEDRDGIVAVLGSPFGATDRYRRGPQDGEGGSPRLSVAVKGA